MVESAVGCTGEEAMWYPDCGFLFDIVVVGANCVSPTSSARRPAVGANLQLVWCIYLEELLIPDCTLVQEALLPFLVSHTVLVLASAHSSSASAVRIFLCICCRGLFWGEYTKFCSLQGSTTTYYLPRSTVSPPQGSTTYYLPLDCFPTGLHDTTFQSIMKCDIDIRKDLYSNIVPTTRTFSKRHPEYQLLTNTATFATNPCFQGGRGAPPSRRLFFHSHFMIPRNRSPRPHFMIPRNRSPRHHLSVDYEVRHRYPQGPVRQRRAYASP